MNTILSTLFIVLLCMVCYFTIFTSERCSKYKWQRIEKYSGEKGKYFIDVRTVGEYRGNHMKGFQNIPK